MDVDLTSPAADGSPAHAGIDLHWQGDHDRWVGFPRTRGDRPEMSQLRESED